MTSGGGGGRTAVRKEVDCPNNVFLDFGLVGVKMIIHRVVFVVVLRFAVAWQLVSLSDLISAQSPATNATESSSLRNTIRIVENANQPSLARQSINTTTAVEATKKPEIVVEKNELSVELGDSELSAKLVLPIDLLPSKEYIFPITVNSRLCKSIDLGNITTSCGCVVTKFSKSILDPGSNAVMTLKIRTTAALGKEPFSKSISIQAANKSVCTIEIIGNVVPYITAEKTAKLLADTDNCPAYETELTFNRPELRFADGMFVTDPSSDFLWQFTPVSDQLVKATFKRKPDRDIPKAVDSLHICAFEHQTLGRVEVYVPVREERPPKFVPSRVTISESRIGNFYVVGDFNMTRDSISAFYNESEIPLVITERSRRVHQVKLAFDELDLEDKDHIVRVVLRWQGIEFTESLVTVSD